jgi:RNA polymerase sigma factor (sigma-70 family)
MGKKKQHAPSAGLANEVGAAEYRMALHRFLVSRLRNSEDAADLVQEAFMRFYALPNSQTLARPDHYLFRIALNLTYEFRLRQERNVEYVSFDSEVSDSSLDALVEPDPGDALGDRQLVAHMLAQIPRAYAQILLLHKRDGRSCKEIAAELDLSVRTVEKYVARALAFARTAVWK